MFLTEKDGGSDVGSGTKSVARAEADGTWRLYGEKWFCSNVGAEIVLTLARPEGAPPGTRGLGLFLAPRTWVDGTPNPFRIHRIKEKLGTRCMATGAMSSAVDNTAALTVAKYTICIESSRMSNRGWNGSVSRNPVSNCTPVCTTRSS